jgi:FlaA1/EpsC-like NDP-sugar epimerase
MATGSKQPMAMELSLQPKWIPSFDLYSRTNQLIIDGCIFATSSVVAWVIRFESLPVGPPAKQLLLWTLILVGTRLIVNYEWGVYRFVWRFVSISDAIAIAESYSMVTAGVTLVWVVSLPDEAMHTWAPPPISVIALEFLISLTGSLAARVLRRVLYETRRRKATDNLRAPVRMVLYGAGRAGILLLRELQTRNDVQVVGFVDDDPRKTGTTIFGIRVYGAGHDLSRLRHELKANEVVISMATAGRDTLRRIVEECHRSGIPTRVIPSLREIVDGGVNISRLQEIHLEDLLGRESVQVHDLDQEAVRCYRGRRILVTGGGGSIGSELVRQLARLEAAGVAILDKDENSVYELQQELLQCGLGHCVEPQIADVRNLERLRTLFAEFHPQVVFHAAAHKHVPLMERHPCEAILNNVTGTKNVLDVSRETGVERFVFISTDKAVNPSSIMGATKRIGELLVQVQASSSSLRAACVRFGNVLGSRGSIIPLFQRQIAQGGPVTVTHPEVERFFMTIPEAVQLILCAGTGANRGEVFVLDMGTPRRILDLAREMVLLSNLQSDRQIEIAFTGLRPGEKLSEELITSAEGVQPTRFDKLSLIVPAAVDPLLLQAHVENLERAAKNNDGAGINEILDGMGIGFRVRSDLPTIPRIPLTTPQPSLPERQTPNGKKTAVWPAAIIMDSRGASG